MLTLKKIQVLSICALVAIALYFSVCLGRSCLGYFPLRAQAQAQVVRWEVLEEDDQFSLKADYTFRAQEKNWQGSAVLGGPPYLNEIAALSALKVKAKQPWSAWYNPKNPSFSALEKSFPAGLLVRTLIVYGVLIYFFYLKRKSNLLIN